MSASTTVAKYPMVPENPTYQAHGIVDPVVWGEGGR